MDVDDNALRHQRMDGGFDRRAKAGCVEIAANKAGAGFASRIVLGEGSQNGLVIDGHEDVTRGGVLQPGARRLDPHDAIVLERGVAAGRLDQKRIGTGARREATELLQFYHVKAFIQKSGCGSSAPGSRPAETPVITRSVE